MCDCVCVCVRAWRKVVHCGGTRLTLIACSPSTPNLRASQACITAQKALSQVVFSLAKRLEKKEKKMLGFFFFFLIALLKNNEVFILNYQNERKDLQRCKAAFWDESHSLFVLLHLPSSSNQTVRFDQTSEARMLLIIKKKRNDTASALKEQIQHKQKAGDVAKLLFRLVRTSSSRLTWVIHWFSNSFNVIDQL